MKRRLCGQDDHQPSGMCQELITVLARCRHTPVITILGSPVCFVSQWRQGVSSVTICCSLLLMINNPHPRWELGTITTPHTTTRSVHLFVGFLSNTYNVYKDFVFSLVQGKEFGTSWWLDCKAKSSPLRNWFATLCFPSENPSKVYKNRPIPSVISGRDQRFARDQNGETIREIVAVMTWQRTWTDCVSLVLLTLGCFVAISESSGSYTTMIGTIHNMIRDHSHHK